MTKIYERHGVKTHILTEAVELDLFGRQLEAMQCYAFDTETSSLNAWKGSAFLLSFSDGVSSWVIPLKHFKLDHVAHVLRPSFAQLDKEMVGHNLKFDAHFAKQTLGLDIGRRWHDTQLQAWLINENRIHKLKELMRVELKMETPEEEQVLEWLKTNQGARENWDYSKLPDDLVLPYSGMDPYGTMKLHQHQMPLIQRHFQGVYDTDCAVLKILYKMEESGLRVDVPYMQSLIPAYEVEAAKWLEGIWQDAGKEFNPDSEKELGDILFKTLNVMPTVYTPTGQPATNDKALDAIDHPIVEKLRAYRSAKYNLSTEVLSVLERTDTKGYVHGDYGISRAKTGRMSCSNPPLQKIRKDPIIRAAYLPDPGCEAWFFDQSQIEMVGLAHYSQDPHMMKVIRDGGDLHKMTAAAIYKKIQQDITKNERAVGKGMNFAVVYMCGDRTLSTFLANYGAMIASEDAVRLKQEHKRGFPEIQRWQQKVIYTVKQDRAPWGRHVKNQFGRVRRIPDWNKAYTAVNHLIQGWAADLMKSAMVKIENDLHPTWKQNIHDAIRVDMSLEWTEEQRLHLAQEIIKRLTDFPQVTVPIRVEAERFSTNWSEVKGVDLEGNRVAA